MIGNHISPIIGDIITSVFGGGSPVFPTTGNVGYYSAEAISDLGFSSANSVNFINDQSSASNDLTQGTASANPLFIEHDTVTQFTLAKQGTWNGTDAVTFAVNSSYGVGTKIGDFTYYFHTNTTLGTSRDHLKSTLNTNARLRLGVTGAISPRSDQNNIYSSPNVLTGDAKIHMTLEGTTLKLFLNFAKVHEVDIGTDTFSFDTLGTTVATNGINGDLYHYADYNRALSEAEITNFGTSQPTDYNINLIATSQYVNTTSGNPVQRWNATSHKPWLNRLLSDGNDDHLEGMAVQTGDFTYMFKLAFNALSTTEYIFSHTTGLSAVVLLSDNYIYLRDTTGANDIGLIGHTVELGEHVYTITREGDSLKYYVDSCLKDTIDVTGRTFELDTFGRPTDSLADLTADWGVWDRALTKDELDYFSYLRSEDTNDILLPPLTPYCPTIYPVNSPVMTGTQAFGLANGNLSVEPALSDFSPPSEASRGGAWLERPFRYPFI